MLWLNHERHELHETFRNGLTTKIAKGTRPSRKSVPSHRFSQTEHRFFTGGNGGNRECRFNHGFTRMDTDSRSLTVAAQFGCTVGFQLSSPPRTDSMVILSACSFVNCFAHLKRFSGLAPGPVLLYSEKRAVNSFVGLRQLFQPSGLICGPISQFK